MEDNFQMQVSTLLYLLPSSPYTHTVHQYKNDPINVLT